MKLKHCILVKRKFSRFWSYLKVSELQSVKYAECVKEVVETFGSVRATQTAGGIRILT